MATEHKEPYYGSGIGCGWSSLENCTVCGKIGVNWLPVTHNCVRFYSTCGSEECLEKCTKMVLVEHQKPYAFGPLFHLRNDLVKVRRSNGDIDDGWTIHSGITHSSHLGDNIMCTKNIDGTHNEKFVSVSVILELNPQTSE